MELPLNRPANDEEIALGVADAMLRTKWNPRSGHAYDPQLFLEHIYGRDIPSAILSLNNRDDLARRAAAYCWRLVGLGYLLPRMASEYGEFYPTVEGSHFLDGFDGSAVTPGGLDGKLAQAGYADAGIPRHYARLAQECFLAGFWGPSVVMLGAASESITSSLADALEKFVQSAGLAVVKARSQAPTANQDLKWLQEAVTTHRRPLEKALTTAARDSQWVEPLGSVIAGTGQAIRLTRNEAGHPTGLAIERSQALELLQLFPRYAAISAEASDALS